MPTKYEIIEFGFADDSVVYAIQFKSGLFGKEFIRNPRGDVMYFYSYEEAEREAEQMLG